MGEHRRAGEGNSLGFTDMNTKNLNSSAPARLFPELSNWQMNAELGSRYPKPEQGLGLGCTVMVCSLPSPLAQARMGELPVRMLKMGST